MKKRILMGALVASALMFGAGAAAPAMAADNLVANGGFDAPVTNNGQYLAGSQFGGWTVGSGGTGGSMQVWWDAALAGPYTNGAYAGVQGTIAQTIQTEVGKTYALAYSVRAAGYFDVTKPGWQGGVAGGTKIDGATVDTFTTVTSPVYTERTFVFTATGTSTELSFFGVTNYIGLDTVSVTLVPENDSPIMIPAIAGGLGVAALAAGSVHLLGRKNKRASA
ncbi:hypothetical protein [Leifsonia kafniensis]